MKSLQRQLMKSLTGHLIGDFYLQNEKMSQKKNLHFKWVLLHGICYLGSMIVVHIPVWSSDMLCMATMAGGAHFIIDSVKFYFLKGVEKKDRKTKRLERDLFFVDQIIHVFCLILIAYTVVKNDIAVKTLLEIRRFFDAIALSKTQFLMWSTALMMIHKPSNIAIQKMLLLHKPETNANDSEKDSNAGRFVGTVERIIMLLLLSVEQYSAMGLVLTAKSIARYDKIARDQNFAEYYLLGTLISVGIVILVSMLL